MEFKGCPRRVQSNLRVDLGLLHEKNEFVQFVETAICVKTLISHGYAVIKHNERTIETIKKHWLCWVVHLARWGAFGEAFGREMATTLAIRRTNLGAIFINKSKNHDSSQASGRYMDLAEDTCFCSNVIG